MRATKYIITVKRERLARLKLPTLKYRRARGDVIEVYKILDNKYDSCVNLYLEQFRNSKGHHSLKLTVDVTISKKIFVYCTSYCLPESVISAETVDTFKNQLCKFWKNHDVM